MATTNPLGQPLAAREAAAYLGISRETLGRLVAAGRVVCHRSGPRCHRRFYTVDLDAYLTSTRVEVTPPRPEATTGRYGRNVDHLIAERIWD